VSLIRPSGTERPRSKIIPIAYTTILYRAQLYSYSHVFRASLFAASKFARNKTNAISTTSVSARTAAAPHTCVCAQRWPDINLVRGHFILGRVRNETAKQTSIRNVVSVLLPVRDITRVWCMRLSFVAKTFSNALTISSLNRLVVGRSRCVLIANFVTRNRTVL